VIIKRGVLNITQTLLFREQVLYRRKMRQENRLQAGEEKKLNLLQNKGDRP